MNQLFTELSSGYNNKKEKKNAFQSKENSKINLCIKFLSWINLLLSNKKRNSFWISEMLGKPAKNILM